MPTMLKVHHLQRLEKLYSAGFHSTFLDTALRKLVSIQIIHDETDLHKINATLKAFEQQYSMTTNDFFQLFKTGQTTDTADMMEWNVAYKMKQRITTRLQILRGADDDE